MHSRFKLLVIAASVATAVLVLVVVVRALSGPEGPSARGVGAPRPGSRTASGSALRDLARKFTDADSRAAAAELRAEATTQMREEPGKACRTMFLAGLLDPEHSTDELELALSVLEKALQDANDGPDEAVYPLAEQLASDANAAASVTRRLLGGNLKNRSAALEVFAYSLASGAKPRYESLAGAIVRTDGPCPQDVRTIFARAGDWRKLVDQATPGNPEEAKRILLWVSKTSGMEQDVQKNLRPLGALIDSRDKSLSRSAELAALRGAHFARLAKGGYVREWQNDPRPGDRRTPEGKLVWQEHGIYVSVVLSDIAKVSKESGIAWLREQITANLQAKPNLSCDYCSLLRERDPAAKADLGLAFSSLAAWYGSDLSRATGDAYFPALIDEVARSKSGMKMAVLLLDDQRPGMGVSAAEVVAYGATGDEEATYNLLMDKLLAGGKIEPPLARRIITKGRWANFAWAIAKRKPKEQVVFLRWLAESGTMDPSVAKNREELLRYLRSKDVAVIRAKEEAAVRGAKTARAAATSKTPKR